MQNNKDNTYSLIDETDGLSPFHFNYKQIKYWTPEVFSK